MTFKRSYRSNLARLAPLSLAGWLALMNSGCALVPHDPPAAADAGPSAAAGAGGKTERVVNVGSRIPNNAGDRMVRRTDAAGAKEMNRERPPEPGPKIN